MRGAGGCSALRGEEEFVQRCDAESGRKLADDLEELDVGLTLPLNLIFKKYSL